MRAPWIRPFALVALAALLAGADGVKPVPLIPEADECAQCRMSVEDEGLAAELIARDGAVLKFDELGCMLAYTKGKGAKQPPAKAMFVKDFTRHAWLRVGEATLISSAFPTPMGYGLLAFDTPAAAKRLPAKYKGKPTTWKALTAP